MPAARLHGLTDAPSSLRHVARRSVQAGYVAVAVRLPGVPARLFFLVQKEVGQRLAGLPGNKTYGALSVLVQAAYDAALVRTLPGSVFYPPPEVESVAVELTPRAQPLVVPADRERFAAIVQRGFSQRRKKLSNLLPTPKGIQLYPF